MHTNTQNIPAAPPENVAAEQSTLGAMLIEAAAIDKAAAILAANDFTRPDHVVLFETIKALHEHGDAVDLVTVQAQLEGRGGLPGGGLAYLTNLYDTVPTAANVEYYAKLVKDQATKRHLWEEASRLAELALKPDTEPGELLEQAERRFARIAEQAGRRTAATRRKPIADRVIDLADVQPPPAELPYLFGPYLNVGATHWLTGATGLGKSTFGFNVAAAIAEGAELWGFQCEQQRVLYLDMESGDIGRSLKVMRLYQDRPRLRGELLFVREPIRLPEELPELIAYVQAMGVSFVIFDTARRCFSVRDENDNAEVYTRIVPTLDALKAVGVGSLVFGHPPKNGGTGARGAGAQEDAGDVNLSLTMHSGEVSDPGGVIALKITKNRLLGLGHPPLLLRRVGNDQFESVSFDEAGPATAGEAPRTAGSRCRADVLAYLQNRDGDPAKHKDMVIAMTALGHAEGTAKRTISKLQKEEHAIVHNLAIGYILSKPFPQ